MPLIFLAIILIAGISFFVANRKKEQHKEIVHFCISVVILVSVLYQFIHIAKYIDMTGERIVDILGTFGIASLWGGLLFITVQTLLLLFEMIAKKRKDSNRSEKKD